MLTKPVPKELYIEAGLDRTSVSQACKLEIPSTDLHRLEVQANVRAQITAALPQWASCAEAVLAKLASPPHFCVLQGLPWIDLPPDTYHATLAALMTLVGEVSDDNSYDANSGLLAEDVRPTNPASRDVTFRFECEVHSDESSKPHPEDIVALWSVRPAKVGGASLIWDMADIIATLRSQKNGPRHESILRSRRYPFGGKLRQPPRVLLATILFGNAGVRFRLGAIKDAFDVLGDRPDLEEKAALSALVSTIDRTPPYRFMLSKGQAVFAMNRMTLHSRETFSDAGRWLIKVRANNPQLSNSKEDLLVGWHDASLSTT